MYPHAHDYHLDAKVAYGETIAGMDRSRLQFIWNFIRFSVSPLYQWVLGAYGLAGAISFIKGELLPPHYAQKQLIQLLPSWPLSTWLMIGLILLLAAVVEGAYQVHGESKSGIKILTADEQEWVRPRKKYRKSAWISVVVAITFIWFFVFKTTEKEADANRVAQNPPSQTAQPLQGDDTFRMSIRHLETGWGERYNPRTAFMSYYTLNKIPTLSPIDVVMYLHIDYNKAIPVSIEEWSLSTSPSRDGPWLRLLQIPGSPHLDTYLVGSIQNQLSSTVTLDDLGDSLDKPIPPSGHVTAWILSECPSEPPCLAMYVRLFLEDSAGHEYNEIESLSEFNASSQLNHSSIVQMPISKAPRRDLTNVRTVRPFPFDAPRIEPKDPKQPVQIFNEITNDKEVSR